VGSNCCLSTWAYESVPKAPPIVQFWEWVGGAMLSRPSEKGIVAHALPAAKACVPRCNWMLSRPGEHAFAASMSKERDSSVEGRESMAPDGIRPHLPCSAARCHGCHAFGAFQDMVNSPRSAGRESMLPPRSRIL